MKDDEQGGGKVAGQFSNDLRDGLQTARGRADDNQILSHEATPPDDESAPPYFVMQKPEAPDRCYSE
jgi:hypothetical protein